MSEKLNHRKFLAKSVITSTAAALGLSLEERALLARESQSVAPLQRGSIKRLPTGQIGNLNITRMLCGGNLTSGYAHSRDLEYVSSLLRHYFTDEKIFETWQICEECGINTAILRLDDTVIRLINKYWDERGGQLQWIAQVKPKKTNLQNFKTDIKMAIDNGAVGAYIQGSVGDSVVKNGRVELLGEAVEFIKKNKVIAGIGTHSLEVPIACEKAGLDPDFYMKTLHKDDYWSATPKEDRPEFALPPHDNMWCTTPEETTEFMQKVSTPWIAFKVLAAGAIHPRSNPVIRWASHAIAYPWATHARPTHRRHSHSGAKISRSRTQAGVRMDVFPDYFLIGRDFKNRPYISATNQSVAVWKPLRS